MGDDHSARADQRRNHESLLPGSRGGRDDEHPGDRLEPRIPLPRPCVDDFVRDPDFGGLPSAERAVLRGRERSHSAIGARCTHDPDRRQGCDTPNLQPTSGKQRAPGPSCDRAPTDLQLTTGEHGRQVQVAEARARARVRLGRGGRRLRRAAGSGRGRSSRGGSARRARRACASGG